MAALVESDWKVGVVVPCYRVRDTVLDVIAGIGDEVDAIYCVDDACPENSGVFIQETNSDPRVRVVFHEHNQGVGGAVMTGSREGLADGCDLMVKVDGDGQMDPNLIPAFIAPLLSRSADYTKGSRFTRTRDFQSMPAIRLFGNSVLSFVTKLSSGYWRTLDPTNGYTAIHRSVLAQLPLDEISRDYFFESDMLCNLRLVGACVIDVPMTAVYADEKSSLKWWKTIPPFLRRHARNLRRRIVQLYFVRDFNIATLQLLTGVPLLLFGVIFGATAWRESIVTGVTASAGSVMLAALPVLVGIQLILAFLHYDISSVPSYPMSRLSDVTQREEMESSRVTH